MSTNNPKENFQDLLSNGLDKGQIKAALKGKTLKELLDLVEQGLDFINMQLERSEENLRVTHSEYSSLISRLKAKP